MVKEKTASRKTSGNKRPKHKPTDSHSRNYSQIAYEFALEASRDRRGKKHNQFVHLAAKRHLKDLKKKTRSWRYQFDEWEANNVCDFIEKLPHVEGVWETPTITLEPPQIFILCVVFGWRRKSDGLRRFTNVYIEMARKGAKSTLTAGVSLYCLCCENEVGPQIIIGATTGEQAKKVFNPANQMVKKKPELREAFGVDAWARSVTCEDSGGFIQCINSKSSTQDGWNPHVGILDELHAHTDRGLYDVIRSAFGARKNPLMWCITTAGYNIDGVCYEQRTLVTKILNGVVEADHYFGIIFTLDGERKIIERGREIELKADDPLDPSTWIKANPMLGVTPTVDSMETFAIEAANSPESMGEFRTKRLNIWTTAKGAWLNSELWKRCNGPVDLEWLKQYPCYGGVDLASVSDITAFVLVWLVSGKLYTWGHYYLPEDTVTPRTKKANLPYQKWVDSGQLIATPGAVTDYEWIKKDIKEALDRFNVKEIGFDPWNATQTVNDLMSEGAEMVEMRQGTKTFNPPMQELERQIKSGTLHHAGDPVLSWMASNVVARKDVNNNMAPDKKNSQEKIDGIVALLMGLGRAFVYKDDDEDFTGEVTHF